MTSHNIKTFHAPGERCSAESLQKQMGDLQKLPLLKQGLDATNSMILILNTCRQAVFANKAFLRILNMQKISELAGQRLGEIISCIHASDAVNGCGTAEACKYCNGVNTILTTIETHEEATGEFSNINKIHGYEKNVNFSIHVAPLPVKGEIFYVVSLADNSDSVQKRILERTFFHDIINTAGALKGIVGLMKDDVPDMMKPEVEFVEESFKSLVDEIQSQKYMMDAENNQLVLEVTSIEITDMLKFLSKLYERHDVARNKIIILDEHSINTRLYTDQRLLRKILGNMVKNALEASADGGVVTLGCSSDDDNNELITLWVHNDQYMDDREQNLVFHRSFSTKGAGRGLGTYSMKLFGETFLKGKVDFVTAKGKGTTFYIRLPLNQVASE